MARQLGRRRVSVVDDLGRSSVASRWTATGPGLEISLATADEAFGMSSVGDVESNLAVFPDGGRHAVMDHGGPAP